MTRPSRPDELFCTKGKHWMPISGFKWRSSGTLHSWCAKCKREYDAALIAAKRKVSGRHGRI